MGKATEATFIRQLADLTNSDVDIVGGKNASLGEMIQRLGGRGVRIPKGFATTADTYWNYLEHNDLGDRIAERIVQARQRVKPLPPTGAIEHDTIIDGGGDGADDDGGGQ